jgi:hypothetical protein
MFFVAAEVEDIARKIEKTKTTKNAGDLFTR